MSQQLRKSRPGRGVPHRTLGLKMNQINQFLEASWNRVLFGFGWILGTKNGAKLAPKWDQTLISHKTRKNAFGASPLVPN